MTGPGAYVANHVSWLDIFVLNAVQAALFRGEIRGRGLARHRLARARHRHRLHRPRPAAGAGADARVRGSAARGPPAAVLSRGHLDRRAARAAVQADAVPGLLLGPAARRRCRSSRSRWSITRPKARGSALLRLVGRHGARPRDPVSAGRARGRAGSRLSTIRPCTVADFPDRKSLAAEAEAAVRKGFVAALAPDLLCFENIPGEAAGRGQSPHAMLALNGSVRSTRAGRPAHPPRARSRRRWRRNR